MESGTGSGVVSCIPAREHQSSRGSTPPAPRPQVASCICCISYCPMTLVFTSSLHCIIFLLAVNKFIDWKCCIQTKQVSVDVFDIETSHNADRSSVLCIPLNIHLCLLISLAQSRPIPVVTQ